MEKIKQGSFLDHLTKGLYDAVVQAQALAENQHIEALSKYVNEDGTPKCMKMIINGEEVNVPLATLAPQNSIKIKELTMDLKVRLNKFGKRKSKLGGGIFCKEDAGAIDADLGSSILPTKNNYANLKITFEGTEPPEGVVRLNNNLIKQIP
jgi:aspartate carbamoyltransferase regulatory subunit